MTTRRFRRHLLPAAGLLALALLAPRASAGPSTGAPGSPLAFQDAAALVEQGRAALERGDAAAALALFERAVTEGGGALDAKTWLVRCWIELGRVNDALDEIDALAKAHGGKSEIDYLYGMAFARSADEKMNLGVNDASLSMNLDDATSHLERATAADAARYKDAFPALARSAWFAQKLPVARAAGDRAVQLYPARADVHFQLGRIALSQYVAAKDDAARAEQAAADLALAESSLHRAVELAAPAPQSRTLAAQAACELGHAYVWHERTQKALDAYAQAMAFDPLVVDFDQVQRSVGVEPFLDGLESAWKAAEPKSAERPARERATLLWWLGFARFRNEQLAPAAQAFQAAYDADASFLNSLYYVARARFAAGERDAAVAALVTYAERDPVDLIAALKFDVKGNVPMLDALAGHCYGPFEPLVGKREFAQAAATVGRAATLQEIANELRPDNAQAWSNLGLFLRDQGNASRGAGGIEPEAIRALFERSFGAYEKALALEPDSPDYLNDAAVVLDYDLDRDLGRAMEMYEKALAGTGKRLGQADLAEADRAHMLELKGWIETNIKRLERKQQEKKGGAGG